MRKIPLLISALVLTALARPTGYAAGSVHSTVEYHATANVSLTGMRSGLYVFNLDDGVNDPAGNPLIDPSGSAAATYEGSGSGLTDGTNFEVSAYVNASLTSTTHDVKLQRLYGYYFMFELTNEGTSAATFSFDVHTTRLSGLNVTGTPWEPGSGLGEFAAVGTYGGVVDKTDSSQGDGWVTSIDSYDNGTPAILPSSTDFNVGFTLAAGQTHTYEVYSSTDIWLENVNPVPEPASLAALGLGTLGFLRRRAALRSA